eukprot:2649303-Prymnesium_polylepis.1
MSSLLLIGFTMGPQRHALSAARTRARTAAAVASSGGAARGQLPKRSAKRAGSPVAAKRGGGKGGGGGGGVGGGGGKSAEWFFDGADWVRRSAGGTSNLTVDDAATAPARRARLFNRTRAGVRGGDGVLQGRVRRRDVALQDSGLNASATVGGVVGRTGSGRLRGMGKLDGHQGKGKGAGKLGDSKGKPLLKLPACSARMDGIVRKKAASRQRLCLKPEMAAAAASSSFPVLWSQSLVAQRGMFRNENPFPTHKFRPFLGQLPARANLSELWHGGCDNCDTCAVVGASGSALRYRHGALIDAHEVVLRPNWLVTKGFEAVVGTRTNLNLFFGVEGMIDQVGPFARHRPRSRDTRVRRPVLITTCMAPRTTLRPSLPVAV